jgi:FKBP-type peptidyl-prolyl cis-trans isomerase
MESKNMDKLNYALGLYVGTYMVRGGIEKIDSVDDFMAGINTVLNDTDLAIPQEEVNETLKTFFSDVLKKREEEEKKNREENLKKGEEYLKENLTREGVKKTDSGLQYKILREGTLMKWPNAHSRVRVHYEGKLIDGTVFDSSYQRGEPVEFGLDQVIPGWSEGVCLMKPGAKYEFTLPAHLAYGEVGVPDRIPGNSVLIFTVELLDIL